MKFIWTKVTYLAESIAQLVVVDRARAPAPPARRAHPPAKRPKTSDVLASFLELPQLDDVPDCDRDLSATEMVAREVQVLNQIARAEWPAPADTIHRWAAKQQRTRMPSLS